MIPADGNNNTITSPTRKSPAPTKAGLFRVFTEKQNRKEPTSCIQPA
jgi:hypothetical protein